MKTASVSLAVALSMLGSFSTAFSQAPHADAPAPSSPQTAAGSDNGSKAAPNHQAINLDTLFSKLDGNNDGSISRSEWEGLPTILSGASAAAGAGGANSGVVAGSASAGNPPALKDLGVLFTELDKNHDGALSKEEFAALGAKLGNSPVAPDLGQK